MVTNQQSTTRAPLPPLSMSSTLARCVIHRPRSSDIRSVTGALVVVFCICAEKYMILLDWILEPLKTVYSMSPNLLKTHHGWMTGFLSWWPCICVALCDFCLCLGFEELERYWKVDRGEAGQFLGWRHSQVFMVIPSRRISMRSCLNIAYRDLFTLCSRTWSLRKQYSYLHQCLNIAVCFLHIQALRRPFCILFWSKYQWS